MAELLNNTVFDNGLEGGLRAINETLHILSGDPGLTWANIAALGLGDKASPTIAAPSDRAGGGREVVVAAITDGSVTATGSATHFALTDDSATIILASQALATPVAVTSGETFTLTSLAVGIPDPA